MSSTPKIEDLTERDVEILTLKWVAKLPNADITARLGWSRSTIARTTKKYADIEQAITAKLAGESKPAEQPIEDEANQSTSPVKAFDNKSTDGAEIPAHFVSTDVVTVAIDGKVHSFDRSHPNYNAVRDAVVGERWEEVKETADYVKKFKTLTFGFFKITSDGILLHKDKEVSMDLADIVIKLNEKDIKPAAILKFLERLKENPSTVSVESAVRFIMHNRLPIDSNGFLLTYKKITKDYKDCYTQSIDNSIGNVIAMERDSVTLNPQQTCAAGLHVCSFSYLGSYSGQRVVICKVDPADIVSVPHDYNNAKMRVMRYEVIHEVKIGEEIPNDYIDETCTWYK